MEFERHKRILNKELDQFNLILGEVLPRYVALMRKEELTPEELKELGELEHFLIEINGKIASIKEKLDHELFGETMDEYYRLKEKAIKGDLSAKKRLDQLRETLSRSIQDDTFFNWN
jgi:hypothetical protein